MQRDFAAGVVCCIALLAVSRAAVAQVANVSPNVYLDESIEARGRLNSIDAYTRDGKWSDAAELLHQLIESGANRIVRVGKEAPDRYACLRTYCHVRLSQLPPEGLAAYRNRVDTTASELLRRAGQPGGTRHLERIVDEFFCSSVADEAIDRLADRALLDGRAAAAANLWARLLPTDLLAHSSGETTADPARLRFPDPDIDVARVAAKRIVALLVGGDRRQAELCSKLLRQHHPKAAGRLTGRNGQYWQIVNELLAHPSEFDRPEADADWPTFAGNFQRSKIAPRPIEVGDVQWTWRFRDEPATGSQQGPNPPRPEEQLVYHPVVAGSRVLLGTERDLRTFDLDTGRNESWFTFDEVNPQNRPGQNARATYTVSIAGNRLFVRSGSPVVNPGFNQFNNFRRMRLDVDSKLYCFDFRSQRLLWSRNSATIGDGNAVFEGSPVATADRVIIAMTRIDAMSQASVAAFDLETGEPKWRTVVCEAPQETIAPRAIRNNLLTLADEIVYYSTNLGAVAAIDARTGHLRWVTTYPRGPSPMAELGPVGADMSPCIVESNRVFLAPTDSPRILCLDAETGLRLWESPWPVGHLLGVAKGKLIATGNRVMAIDIVTGKASWYWPENTARGYGRGVLAGDYIYWPTFSEIHVLDQETGRKVHPSIPLFERLGIKGGNMIVGSDCLILAQADRVLAIYPYRRLLRRLQHELAGNPESATLHFQIAQAAIANNELTLAIAHLEQSRQFAKTGEVFEGVNLAVRARHVLVATLLRHAEAVIARDGAPIADSLFVRAVQVAAPGTEQVETLRRIVAIWIARKDARRAVATAQQLVENPKLRHELVAAEGFIRIPAGAWAASVLAAMLRQGGSSVYADFERRARQQAADADKPERWLEVVDAFPAYSGRCELLLAAANAFEKQARPVEARQAFLRLLGDTEAVASQQIDALIGLHRVYTGQRLGSQARAILDRLASEYGQHEVAGQPGITVAEFVRKAHGDAAKVELGLDDARAEPLVRVFSRRTTSAESLLLPVGQPPPGAPDCLLSVTAHHVTCLTSADGATLWSVEGNGRFGTAAYGPAGLLLATSDLLVCLRYDSGSIVWRAERISRDDDAAWITGARTVRAATTGDGRPRRTHETDTADDPKIVVVGDVVLTMRGSSQLVALDAETGSPIWEASPGGALGFQVVGSIVCIANDNRLHGLELRSGKLLFQSPIRGTGNVVATAEHLVLRSAPDEVAAIDPGSGKMAWKRAVLPPSVHPLRLFSAGDSLIGFFDGWQLSRFDRRDGSVLWERAVAGRPVPDVRQAHLCGEQFVVLTHDGIQCHDLTRGKLNWQQPQSGPWTTRKLIPLESQVVVWASGATEAALFAYNITDGRIVRSFRLDELGERPRLAWNRRMLLAAGDRQAYLLSTSRDQPAAR